MFLGLMYFIFKKSLLKKFETNSQDDQKFSILVIHSPNKKILINRLYTFNTLLLKFIIVSVVVFIDKNYNLQFSLFLILCVFYILHELGQEYINYRVEKVRIKDILQPILIVAIGMASICMSIYPMIISQHLTHEQFNLRPSFYKQYTVAAIALLAIYIYFQIGFGVYWIYSTFKPLLQQLTGQMYKEHQEQDQGTTNQTQTQNNQTEINQQIQDGVEQTMNTDLKSQDVKCGNAITILKQPTLIEAEKQKTQIELAQYKTRTLKQKTPPKQQIIEEKQFQFKLDYYAEQNQVKNSLKKNLQDQIPQQQHLQLNKVPDCPQFEQDQYIQHTHHHHHTHQKLSLIHI
eukprot:TRINITY_DN11669_c0_g1_i1.p2 TRINITY_DN11669_c0_g1~~TRINITY_DN11669_c0_g1_i1.p2  ORF type:complete len:346 (+),score=41.44 TRINITY_DN11669_c0_g1_i1:1316-2353(+)